LNLEGFIQKYRPFGLYIFWRTLNVKEFFMKNLVSGVTFILLMVRMFYPANAQSSELYKPIGISEVNSLDIIGTVQIQIEKATTSMDGKPSMANKEEAYIRLLAVSRPR